MAQAGSRLDPVVLDPQHYRIEFENERARVLRVRFGPREKSVMHSHPSSVLIYLTDAVARFTFPDGSAQEIRGSAGEIHELPPTMHLPESLDDRPFEVAVIELKGS